jgi:hypothetical protein
MPKVTGVKVVESSIWHSERVEQSAVIGPC